jgi:hypothetical protein
MFFVKGNGSLTQVADQTATLRTPPYQCRAGSRARMQIVVAQLPYAVKFLLTVLLHRKPVASA